MIVCNIFSKFSFNSFPNYSTTCLKPQIAFRDFYSSFLYRMQYRFYFLFRERVQSSYFGQQPRAMDLGLRIKVTQNISYFRMTLPKGAGRSARTVVRRSRTLILRLRKTGLSLWQSRIFICICREITNPSIN